MLHNWSLELYSSYGHMRIELLLAFRHWRWSIPKWNLMELLQSKYFFQVNSPIRPFSSTTMARFQQGIFYERLMCGELAAALLPHTEMLEFPRKFYWILFITGIPSNAEYLSCLFWEVTIKLESFARKYSQFESIYLINFMGNDFLPDICRKLA